MKSVKKKSTSLLDLSKFQTLDVNDIVSASSGKDQRSFTVVYTKKNGKRVKLSKGLKKQLGNPDAIQVLYRKTSILIGPNVLNDSESFEFSASDDCIIYDSRLCQKLKEAFNLNFDNKTSITFRDIRIKKAKIEGETVKVAVINMVPDSKKTQHRAQTGQ